MIRGVSPGKALLTGLAMLGLGISMALASGCSSAILPGQGEPPDLYDLSPKSTFGSDLPEADWQLVVETPTAAASLNTPRIALKRGQVTLEYYAGASWTDLAPQLVQTLIVESFENTHKIVAVGREHASLRSDYLLKTDLREFQAEYNGAGPPVAHVQINAKLVKMPQRTIIAGENFDFKVDSDTSAMTDIVKAFDLALGKTLKRLVYWTMTAPGEAAN